MNEETAELTADDIEPLERAFDKMNPTFGVLEYKGKLLSRKMIQNALGNLKAIRYEKLFGTEK